MTLRLLTGAPRLQARLTVAALAALALIGTQATAADSDDQKRPNIVFIFADDQCFDTIAALGNSEVETPNLDRLAQRGTTFTHAYNMGSWSGAVCVASRMMLNSGRFIWNAEPLYRNSEQERKAGRWWSEYLKDAGYRTYMTGKWHCRANAEKAFDVVRDVRGGMPQQTDAGYDRPQVDPQTGEVTDPWSPSDPKFGGFWQGGTHWSEVVANHSEDFLRQASEESAPFFMYLAFNAPHDPRQSPAEYVAKYPRDQIQLPSNFLPEYPYADAMGAGHGLRDERLAPFPRTPLAVKTHRQEYYAIITHMDAMIGRILDALENTGRADNTWIFFSADHGLACGQHGLMGKQNLYDHSVRVPLMVIGPDVPAGEKIDQPVYLQDIMPTTLELAEVEKPEHVDFQSLLPLLDGEPSRYESIYGAYLDRQRSIRTDTHKLIVYPRAGVARLYDVVADPHEQHDLAQSAEHQGTLRKLVAELKELQASMKDSLDLNL
ncbi:sulfatase-like hydrolase/transferase [Roseiconus nitratireducens]|uniref:Sulfatase-like hydrolase/transferase n=1 Tax=Roseiconus nitratireducens TaxID=2605748 RepID=A0A5M6CXE3_9BACT|nr:sulfatase-like hydrolase/transferase [Roseiconus nitratireducens]KAA5539898.1 sulfatase-like hydrolase/transferase [Roseiconus nitratireducens]